MADPRQEQLERERQAVLRQLDAMLEQAAREAVAAQGLLQDTISKVSGASGQVVSVVGGSTQQIDQAMVQSLEVAVGDSNLAVAALSTAAASARFAR